MKKQRYIKDNTKDTIETISRGIIYALLVIPMFYAVFVTSIYTGIAFTVIMLAGAIKSS